MRIVYTCTSILLLCVTASVSLVLLRHLDTHAAPRAAVPNPNCTLIVPPNPLSATGLATPWQFTATHPANGPCNEGNPAQSVFVQAAIFDPQAKSISIYNPLVIDKGSTPAVTPTVPQLPAQAVVGIWGGGNDTVTRLRHLPRGNLTMVNGGSCVNGTPTPFGQVFFCNAAQFFQAVNKAGVMTPNLGTGRDGQPCPSVRDFSVVDQDQSDNVTTTYLVNQAGQTAQNTAANRTKLMGAATIVNPSDNALLDKFIDPALGCTPAMSPDLADAGAMTPNQPLNELQAAAHQGLPRALVPAGDPMVLVNNTPNMMKLNLYRMGVDQPQVANLNMASTTDYCKSIQNTAPNRLLMDKNFFVKATSPVPTVANSLFTFLAQRLQATFSNNGLNCTGLLNAPNPVQLTIVNGVATDAKINGM